MILCLISLAHLLHDIRQYDQRPRSKISSGIGLSARIEYLAMHGTTLGIPIIPINAPHLPPPKQRHLASHGRHRHTSPLHKTSGLASSVESYWVAVAPIPSKIEIQGGKWSRLTITSQYRAAAHRRCAVESCRVELGGGRPTAKWSIDTCHPSRVSCRLVKLTNRKSYRNGVTLHHPCSDALEGKKIEAPCFETAHEHLQEAAPSTVVTN